jgi:Leucine-rich repeat (LRR) protein
MKIVPWKSVGSLNFGAQSSEVEAAIGTPIETRQAEDRMSEISKRPWFRYSMRTLLLLMTIVAFWLGYAANQVRIRKQAIDSVTRAGAEVTYLKDKAGSLQLSGPAWLRRFLGDEWFVTPRFVFFRDYSVTDDKILPVRALTSVRRLDLSDTKISDKALVAVGEMDGLEHLYLMGTNVTDAGLQHLDGLKRLRVLDLQGTNVTDAGLDYLREMRSLNRLLLKGSRVKTIPEWMRERKTLRVKLE